MAPIIYKYTQGETGISLKNFDYLNTLFAFSYTSKLNTNSYVKGKMGKKAPLSFFREHFFVGVVEAPYTAMMVWRFVSL